MSKVESLKKRYSLPGKVITHIFEGEVSGNNFAGFHSEAVKSIEDGDVEVTSWFPGQQQRRREGKSYKANVKVKIDGKWYGPGFSSFFPRAGAGSDWTKDNIIRWLEQGLTNPKDKDRPSRGAWKDNPRAIRKSDTGTPVERVKVNGVTCEIQYQGKNIASIYPIVPDA
jgi:hypothetical protein